MYSLYFNTKMHAVQYRKRKYFMEIEIQAYGYP